MDCLSPEKSPVENLPIDLPTRYVHFQLLIVDFVTTYLSNYLLPDLTVFILSVERLDEEITGYITI